MVDTIAAAVGVLNQTQHRGIRAWHYDARLGRVMPESWNMTTPEAPPCFTAFEALTIARALVGMGLVPAVGAPPVTPLRCKV